ncbi:MAG: CopD family protein [Rhizobiaceae bacterium]|nr:CopD family protein [Rhizobiaceae bacterium]
MIPRTSPSRQGAAKLLLCVLALLLQATAGLAHASLNATEPVDGAVVAAAPQSYSLTFSESVAPLSLRLIRPDGTAVALERFAVVDRTVRIEAPASLGTGTHVLSWRVVSADGHPIGGSTMFSIGAPSAAAPLVEEAVDWPVRAGLWLAKVALYLGLFFGVGGVFAMRVLMPGLTAGRRVVDAALLIGTVGASISLGFQGLDALGAPAARLSEAIVWSTGFGTSYGSTALLAVAAFAAAAVAGKLRGTAGCAGAVLALTAAGAALALSGHASAAEPQWLMRPAVFLHAVAVAVWIGALMPLGLALKRGAPGAIDALRRFSKAIPLFVAMLVAAGIGLAIVQVERPGALLDTAYGQVFLVKLVLLVGLFVMAVVNRWSLTRAAERRDGAATRRLVRSIAAETLVALAIFGAVAAWRFTPPPRALAAAAAEPASIHIHTAKAMADLTVSPGRAGPVTVSAVVMTGDFGALDAKEVTFVFSNPAASIEPFKKSASKPGDGTWRAEDVVLPLPGVWHVRIDILISDFDMARLEGEVRIRP